MAKLYNLGKTRLPSLCIGKNSNIIVRLERGKARVGWCLIPKYSSTDFTQNVIANLQTNFQLTNFMPMINELMNTSNQIMQTPSNEK